MESAKSNNKQDYESRSFSIVLGKSVTFQAIKPLNKFYRRFNFVIMDWILLPWQLLHSKFSNKTEWDYTSSESADCQNGVGKV